MITAIQVNTSDFNVAWWTETIQHQRKSVDFLLIIDLNVNGTRVTDNPQKILEYVQTMLNKEGKKIIDYRVIIRDINLEWFYISFQETMTHAPINVQSQSLGFSTIGFNDYPSKAIEAALAL